MRSRNLMRCAAATFAVAVLVCAFPALAQEAAAAADQDGGGGFKAVIGSLGGLLLGVVQLVVGLSMAAFAVTKGLQLLSKLLGGIEIWGQIKEKNIAVALLGAGVVISYTNVIGSGISSMTDALNTLAGGEWYDGFFGLISGLLNLGVAIALASAAITVVFKVMDRLTQGIDEKAEFKAGNTAIGAIYAGILIGVSQLVSAGVEGVGVAVSQFLSALGGAVGIG